MRHFRTIIIVCTIFVLLQQNNGECGITTVSYDQSGRLVSVNYSDPGRIQYSYDLAGNIEKILRIAGVANMVDIDGDGMDDGWEILYGLDPTVNDANEDYDNDGITNLIEYQNGTVPVMVGDVNRDGNTDMQDLIMVLQLMAGLQPEVYASGDVDGDYQIGMAEAIYLLQSNNGG